MQSTLYKISNVVDKLGNEKKVVKVIAPYKMTEAQKSIHDCKKRFIVVNAGRRFGKTKYSILWVLKKLEQPNQIVWFVADTAVHAKDLVWSVIVNLIPPEVIKRKNVVEKRIVLINDSELVIRGSDREDSLRGHGIDAVVMEEYAFQKSTVWENIIRPQLIDRKGSALFISTPSRKRGPHFQELCIDAQKEYIKDPLTSEYAYFHFTIQDNPHLPKEEVEHLRQTSTDFTWRQEYMAEFIDEEGQVYPEFNALKNVFNPTAQFPNVNQMSCVRAMDWGMEDRTALLYLHIDSDGRVYVSEEYSESGHTLNRHIEAIRHRDIRHPAVISSVIDCSVFKRESDGISIGQHLNNSFTSNYHRFCKSEGKRTPIDFGISLIKQMLYGDGTQPYLYISNTCKYLIEGLKKWNYGGHEPDSLAALRYGLVHIHRRRFSKLCEKGERERLMKAAPNSVKKTMYRLDPPGVARKQFEWDYDNGGWA